MTRDRRIISQQQGLLQRRNVRSRFLASCGHLIHNSNELGGRCKHKNCDALVCRECLRICERCFKPICPKHSKFHNGKVYCPTCKLIVLLFGSLVNRESFNEPQPQLRAERGRGIFFNPSLVKKWNNAVGKAVYGKFWRIRRDER